MESRLFKEFVGNGVATIQEKTEGSQWNHVSGHNNPADLATKGIDPQELIKPGNIWFSGPSFLDLEFSSRRKISKKRIECRKKKC